MASPSLRFLTFRDTCWSCGKTILGLRGACPHCGKPTLKPRKAVYWLYLVILLVAVAGAGAWAAIQFLGWRT